jgi:transposase
MVVGTQDLIHSVMRYKAGHRHWWYLMPRAKRTTSRPVIARFRRCIGNLLDPVGKVGKFLLTSVMSQWRTVPASAPLACPSCGATRDSSAPSSSTAGAITWESKLSSIHPARFEVLARRWIVEPTWSWLMNSRRLQVDYERNPIVTEGFIRAAHSRYPLRRLTQTPIA